MGSRGPLPKPADQVRNRRKRPARDVVQPVAHTTPPPDAEWLQPTKDAWQVYWQSDLARSALDVDGPAIRRLFALYDQYERSMAVVRRALVVKGSMGQVRANPLADHALKLEVAILRLENELGLTPAARSRLGITTVRKDGGDSQPQEAPYADGRFAHLRAVS